MFFKSSKKMTQKQLDELCNQVTIFIQVHYVRERNNDRYKFNMLPLKDDPDRKKLQEWLEENKNPETFSELCPLFISKADKDEAVICDKAGLEKNYFSRLKNPGFHPTKCEVVSLCLAMKLNIEETRILLRSADYALTNSEKPDLIIRYFIENGLYHIDDLNYILDKLCETSLDQL